MSCCARCGQGICSTAGKIALNKAWHKNCFCCYSCSRPLHVNTAKIYYGEVFCACCCPQVQEIYPLKICRVNSTPSLTPDCCPKSACCNSSDSDYCRTRDVHSCSCIPACCVRECNPCVPEEICCKRVRPRSPKATICCPPRQRSPRCPCSKCCPVKVCPKRKYCQEVCFPIRKKPPACCPSPPVCCEGKRRVTYFQPCNNNCCNKCCCIDRCRRCGEKVFAAEKILTAYGSYHLGCFSCYCCCKSLCVKTMYEACGEIYCRQCYNNYFGVSGYGYGYTCC